MRRDGSLSIAAYVDAMEEAGATGAAANNTLHFLEGTRAIRVTEFGDICRVDAPVTP